jgi:flavin reductase (DIM6/NTAB) family NADH-FMN oxidoreductase RutF
MKQNFNEVSPEQISDNPFKLIGKDWMLITAGDLKSYNTMTASWGGLGHLWNKNVCFCFIRPQRYTYQFIQKYTYFSFSFFEEEYRSMLNLCGTKSGKNVNKAAETGLHPLTTSDEPVYFEEARLVIVSKKIYFCDIDPHNFLDPSIDSIYPQKDYHRMFIGEIKNCLKRVDRSQK